MAGPVSLMSYNAPRGDSELEDLSYDGYLDSGIMKGGLGQLVDGVYGSDDFLLEAREPSSGPEEANIFVEMLAKKTSSCFYLTDYLPKLNH
uniref:Discoidin domain-containing protein n=1 Tax=Rhodnius prolixus TaxID=13249 RepID=T1I6J9_RHOPR